MQLKGVFVFLFCCEKKACGKRPWLSWWWWGGKGQKPVELQRLSPPTHHRHPHHIPPAATSTSSSRPTGMCVCERVLEAALLSAAHPALQTPPGCRTGEAAQRAGGPVTTTTEASRERRPSRSKLKPLRRNCCNAVQQFAAFFF